MELGDDGARAGDEHHRVRDMGEEKMSDLGRIIQMANEPFDEIERLRARIAELEQERRWIPVSERLPEYGERVLFFGGGEMTTHIGYYVPELPQWTAEDGGYYHGKNAALITHWMPLPSFSESEKQ